MKQTLKRKKKVVSWDKKLLEFRNTFWGWAQEVEKMLGSYHRFCSTSTVRGNAFTTLWLIHSKTRHYYHLPGGDWGAFSWIFLCMRIFDHYHNWVLLSSESIEQVFRSINFQQKMKLRQQDFHSCIGTNGRIQHWPAGRTLNWIHENLQELFHLVRSG